MKDALRRFLARLVFRSREGFVLWPSRAASVEEVVEAVLGSLGAAFAAHPRRFTESPREQQPGDYYHPPGRMFGKASGATAWSRPASPVAGSRCEAPSGCSRLAVVDAGDEFGLLCAWHARALIYAPGPRFTAEEEAVDVAALARRLAASALKKKQEEEN